MRHHVPRHMHNYDYNDQRRNWCLCSDFNYLKCFLNINCACIYSKSRGGKCPHLAPTCGRPWGKLCLIYESSQEDSYIRHNLTLYLYRTDTYEYAEELDIKST